MILTPIEQKHIGDLWEWVREGLLEIKRRATPESCPWRPEDIYYSLRSNGAALYVVGAEDGFIVVQRVESGYERVLFVWAMYAQPGVFIRHKLAIMDSIKQLARSAGLNRVRMCTSRDSAWAGTGLMVPVSTIFECEA